LTSMKQVGCGNITKNELEVVVINIFAVC
jgi:hypothetical protein